MTFTPEVWEAVLRHIRNEVPDFAFRAWVEPLLPGGLSDGAPRLLCPSRFHSERIRKDFLPRIRAHLCKELGEDVEVQLGVATDRVEPSVPQRASLHGEVGQLTPTRSVEAAPRKSVTSPLKAVAELPNAGLRNNLEYCRKKLADQ